MRYLATIKWLDNGNIEDNVVFKIGDPEEDDDDVFFYLNNEEAIESFKTEGVHDWVIISIERENE